MRTPPLDITATLRRLAPRRPVFHAEADLQHELAWQIRLDDPQTQVRLERRPEPLVREAADLWVVQEDGSSHVVEVKYLVRRADVTVAGERFVLTDQSAHDTRRYDVLRDLARIERWTAAGLAAHGTVVVLTNVPAFWKPWNGRSNDAAFRIHEGRRINGTLAWDAAAALGSIAGREAPIQLTGTYDLRWRDYAELPDGQRIRALIVATTRPVEGV
ncbi:MAG: hypothetical protein R6U94_11395 [Nitriliruptoraceae bacterium]